MDHIQVIDFSPTAVSPEQEEKLMYRLDLGFDLGFG